MLGNISALDIAIGASDHFSRVFNELDRKLQKVGNKTKNIGKTLTRNVTVPLTGIGVASVMASNQLNEGMANVGTLMPENIDKLYQFREGLKGLRMETGKFAKDATEGLYQTVSAFGAQGDVLGRLRVGLRASVAGVSDTKSAISLLSGVTKAYGDTSVEAMEKVSDLAFTTVRLGETTFPELAENMGKVNAIANNLDISLEELFASIATGTGPLGNTSETVTKLKGAMVALTKPTTDMEKAFQVLGVKSGRELIKREGGMVRAIQKIRGVADKYGVEMSKLFGRTEGLSFALAMSSTLADQYTKKLDGMRKTSEATDKAFKAQTEGINKLGFQLKQSLVGLQTIGEEIGRRLMPKVIAVIDKLTWLGEAFLNSSDATKDFIINLGILAAAIGPILTVIGTLITFTGKWKFVFSGLVKILPAVSGAFKAVGAALGTVAGMVSLIVAAVAIWVYNIVLIIKNWKALISIFESKFNFFQTLAYFFQDISQSLADITSKIPFLGGLSRFFGEAATGFGLEASERAMDKYGFKPQKDKMEIDINVKSDGTNVAVDRIEGPAQTNVRTDLGLIGVRG